MSPQLALLICAVAVGMALLLDSRRTPRVSKALWIPLIWVAILASRPVTQWLNPGSMTLDAGAEDGSPMDRYLLSFLMFAAAVTLVRRRMQWTLWIKNNAWIFAFFVYCGISVVWSDFPAVASKRWIRAIGAVMMILVILSESDPVAAVATIIRRCALILVPASVVLIKYYRELAVAYNYWTGSEIVVGVTTDKNALGRLCLICGLFAFWEFTTARHNKHIQANVLNWLISAGVFVITLWLLQSANSATSLASFLIGCFMVVVLGLQIVQKGVRFLGTLIIISAFTVFAMSLLFDLPETVVTSLGRDLTLTDRTFIWHDLLEGVTNPLLGVGYDSFWLGERLDHFVQVHKVNEAHNGYLAVYLELGIVGLILFAGVILSVFAKAKRSLAIDPAYGRLRIAILTIFLFYNITESGYKATTFIFFVLLLIAVEVPATRKLKRAQHLEGRSRTGAMHIGGARAP